MSLRVIPLGLTMTFLAAPAWAQGPYVPPNPNPNNPYARPLVSPYINLFRTNNPAIAPGINFIGITRPEFQLYGDVGQLQRQVSSLQTGATGAEPMSNVPMIGHPLLFQNLSHYYSGAGMAGTGLAGRSGAGVVRPTYPQGGQSATAGPTPARTR